MPSSIDCFSELQQLRSLTLYRCYRFTSLAFLSTGTFPANLMALNVTSCMPYLPLSELECLHALKAVQSIACLPAH